MKTIAVTNRKGGTGKTTIATHLAAGFAIMGHRVALIDVDPQGNAASMFGLQPDDGLFRVLVEGASVSQNFLAIPATQFAPPDLKVQGSLHLLPSSSNTFRIPYHTEDVFVMLELTQLIKDDFDYLIIDTNPTLTGFDSAIGMATDAYIYVSEAERMSLEGVTEGIRQTMVNVQKRQTHLKLPTTVLGIVPNKVRQRTALHSAMLETLRENYQTYVWQPIHLSTTWAEASALGNVVYTYAPSSKATQEAWQLVETAHQAVEKWQKQTA